MPRSSQAGRVAALSRSRSADDAEYLDARRALAATQLEQYVTKVVSTAPPLTDEQRDRIVVLLHGPPSTPPPVALAASA